MLSDIFVPFRMPRRWRRDRRMVREILAALEDLASDVAALRAQVASVRGKQAVVAREDKRSATSPEQQLLEKAIGGSYVGSLPKGVSLLDVVAGPKPGRKDGGADGA